MMRTNTTRSTVVAAALAAWALMGAGDSQVAEAATLTVLNTSGDATVADSLPFLVAQANASIGVADVIVFDPALFDGSTPQTITLDEVLGITDDLTIVGPGADALTVTRATGDIVHVGGAAEPAVTLSGMRLADATDSALSVSQSAPEPLPPADHVELRLSEMVFESNAVGVEGFSTALIDISDSAFVANSVSGMSVVSSTGYETPVIDLDTVSFADHPGYAIELTGPDTVMMTYVTVRTDGLVDAAGEGIRIVDATAPVGISYTEIRNQAGPVFGNGLFISGAASTVSIDDVDVIASRAFGLFAQDVVGDVAISQTVLDRNGRDGALVDDSGAVSIVDSTTSGNSEVGVRITGTGAVTIADHVSKFNTGAGLQVSDVTGLLDVSGATFDLNGAQGVVATDVSGGVSVEATSASSNVGAGLAVTNSVVALVDVVADDNAAQGLDVQTTAPVTMTGSSFDDNDQGGAIIRNASTVTVSSTTFDRNLRVTIGPDSNIYEGSGLVVEAAAGAVRVDGSSFARSNGVDGIRVVDSPGPITMVRAVVATNRSRGFVLGSSGGTIGNVVLDRVAATGNGAQGASIRSAGTVTVTGGQISTNHLATGPGGSAAAADDGAGLDIRTSGNVSISAPIVSANGGTGVRIADAGTVSFTDGSIINNGRDGVRISGSGAVTLNRTSVRSNAAVGVRASTTGAVSTTSATFVSNVDGLAIDGATGRIDVVATTFTGQSDTGLTVVDAASRISITDDVFTDNQVGFELDGGTAAAPVTITRTDISGTGGDAVRITDAAGTVGVVDAEFDDNGVAVRLDNVDGNVSITGTEFTRSTDRVVGATDLGGDLTLTKVSASNNNRGVVLDAVAGRVLSDRSSFFDSGGAGRIVANADSPLEVTDVNGGLELVNSSIFGITGSVPVRATGTRVTVRHSTIDANSSVYAVQTDTALTLDHSIVLGGVGGSSFRLVASAGGSRPQVTATYSILESNAGLGGTNLEVGTADLEGPDFSIPGPPSRAPRSGSPAVGAGNPRIAGAPATDQRGRARIVGVIDIGAVEISPGSMVPLPPARFADTRPTGATFDTEYAGDGKLGAQEEYEVQIAGRGLVPASASGVVMNVTAVAAEGNGFVTVHPCVTPRPLASSLNYTAGVNLGNEIIAGLSDTGSVCLYTRRAAHLTVDVTGFVPDGSTTVSLTPSRFLDTRPAGETVDGRAQRGGRTRPGGTTVLHVAGRNGVPANAAAVIVNITAVAATERGYVTVSPCVTPLPVASSLNHEPGVNRGNELIATLDAKGDICIFTNRSIHLTADVVGYLPAGATVRPVDPARILDTRPGQPTVDGVSDGEGPRAAGSTSRLDVAGRAGVPPGATAAVVNVTAVGATATGYVTVHPCVTPAPVASSLNYVAGVNGGNEIVASLDATGDLCLFTNRRINITVDVVGYVI